MSHVRSRGSQREQSLDLGVSVVRSEVKVQAILRRLRLRDRREKESRKPIRGGSDLELGWVGVYDNPAEGLSPPESEGTRVARIDDRLLPLEAHEPIVQKLLPGCPENAGWVAPLTLADSPSAHSRERDRSTAPGAATPDRDLQVRIMTAAAGRTVVRK